MRLGGLDPGRRAALLDGVRRLLLDTVRPDGYPTALWATYQQWLSGARDEELATFVSDFEWATLTPPPTALREKIVARLSADGHAVAPADAERQYDRAVVSVLRILAQPGIKQLTRANLVAILADASVDMVAGALALKVGAIQRDLADVLSRIVTVEERVTAVAPWVERARQLVDPAGDTQTFQHTGTFLGRRLDAASTFHHLRPLLGRDTVRDTAVAALHEALVVNRRAVVILGGHAGVGKSRVLLEVIRRLEAEGTAVRWVRDEGTVTPAATIEPPDGPLVVACDDAHRRPDLQALFRLVNQRTAPTAVLLGVRPWGRPALRQAALRADVSFGDLQDLGDLPDLDRATLLTLVREELGDQYAVYAEPLVVRTQDSVLVALVAARLLRTQAIPPTLLAHHAEFAYAVLGRFRDELLGQLGNGVDPSVARRTLEYVAALGPVTLVDDEVADVLARALQTDPVALRRLIGALTEAGVLRDDQGRIRIIPDVLADHILAEAVMAAGRPTGFERQVLTAVGVDMLPPLVRNLAELQWQLTTSGQRVDVFGAAWWALIDHFPAISNRERMELLDRLTPVAAFQPQAVLDLITWVVDHPAVLRDTPPRSGPFATHWSAERVVDKLPQLLGVATQHEEHYDAAIDLLWRLGREGDRATAPHPKHAIRVLDDVASYSPRDHVWRKVKALEALRRWTRSPDWAQHPHSPLGVAKALLSTTIAEHDFDSASSSVTLTRIPINPMFVWETRAGVVELLADLVLGDTPRGRMLALDLLLHALDRPEEQFAHVVPPEEEEQWRPQYEAALVALERVLVASDDSLVRLTTSDRLGWTAYRTTLDWLARRSRAMSRSIGESPDIRAMRVVTRHFPDPPDAGDWRAREVEGERLTADLAETLAQMSAEDVIDFVRVRVDHAASAGETPQPQELLAALADRRSDLAVEITAWLLGSDMGAPSSYAGWLPTLLMSLRATQPDAYTAMLVGAATHDRPDLRYAAAGTLWQAGRLGWSAEETELVRALLGDRDHAVRVAALRALWHISAAQAGGLLDIVRIDADRTVAHAVAELWVRARQGNPPQVDKRTAASLLTQLLDVSRLDDHHGGFERMIAALAQQVPTEVVDFIMERTQRELARLGSYGESATERYDAIPYCGWHAVWRALQQTPQYPGVVRRLRDALHDAHDMLSDAVVDVIRHIVVWDSEVETAFREWITADDGARLRALVPFLEGLDATFVLEQRPFVVDLIDAAARAGPETVRAVGDALRTAASHRPIAVRPVGAPDSIDVRLRTEAAAFAGTRPVGAQHRAFYEAVAADAAGRLDRQQQRDARPVEALG